MFISFISRNGETNSESDTISIEYQPISTLKVRPMTRCVDTLPGHASPVLHVSFSPDGKKIASGGGDMALRFWNAYTHLPLNMSMKCF